MWKTVEYTKKEINNAGKKIALDDLTDDEYAYYLKIIDNWRAAHAFPMNTFAVNLKHLVEDIDGAIVVQRLKRLKTIEGKIKRYPQMELYRMQDLGGCRVILPTIKDVYIVKKKLMESRIRHELHHEKDYIAIPKLETGYRGLHLIYKYKSDKREDYNGLLVEIQIRTKLQHLWATAVETVGLFTQNGLKFNQGSDRWLRFFKIVSAVFSVEEKSAIVDGVPANWYLIIEELFTIMEELKVQDKLLTIGLAVNYMGRLTKSKTPGYYILKLDTENFNLNITKYANIEKATEVYNKIELEQKDSKIDVVLVSAQSFEALTNAYPNYFADISEFLETLLQITLKYTELLGVKNK